jgi:Uma2 family endonuclease
MSMMLQGGPFKAPVAGFRTFTVAEYHKMIDLGVLTEDDRIELLEGYLVEKMPHDPIRDGTIQLVDDAVAGAAPAGWCGRVQLAAALPPSEPEPDFVLARGNKRSYLARHPGVADIGLVIEVSNTSLDSDRTNKLRIYARAALPVYWIVNVVDRQVEVYEQPSGPTADPSYGASRIYKPGDAVPLELDRVLIGTIPVAELLP